MSFIKSQQTRKQVLLIQDSIYSKCSYLMTKYHFSFFLKKFLGNQTTILKEKTQPLTSSIIQSGLHLTHKLPRAGVLRHREVVHGGVKHRGSRRAADDADGDHAHFLWRQTSAVRGQDVQGELLGVGRERLDEWHRACEGGEMVGMISEHKNEK